MSDQKIIYFPDTTNPVFNIEVSKFILNLHGIGIELGCGYTGVLRGNITVDIDKKVPASICCNCTNLPVKDNTFDYLIAMHILEHVKNPKDALLEWRRVIKKGGKIILVHPDVFYTGKQKSSDENLDKNPYNKHTYEMTMDQFLNWFRSLKNTGLKIIEMNEACPKWSFYIIFEKI